MRYPPVFLPFVVILTKIARADFSRNIESTFFAAKTDYHLVIGIS